VRKYRKKKNLNIRRQGKDPLNEWLQKGGPKKYPKSEKLPYSEGRVKLE